MSDRDDSPRVLVRRQLGLRCWRRAPSRGQLPLAALLALVTAGSVNAVTPYRQEVVPGLAGLDVGRTSTPSLLDFDGDGDLDAVAGGFDGTLHAFRNVGSSSTPRYVEVAASESPFVGVDVGFESAPALGDLDGDGDLDILAGDFFGFLHYFENTGSAAAPAYVERTGTVNPMDGIQVDNWSAPNLADLDGDGDLDVAVGEDDERVRYFRNSGTSNVPAFVERTGTNNPFPVLAVMRRLHPTLADLDGDGDRDAVVGTFLGTLRTLRNTGTSNAPAFVELAGTANPFNTVDLGYATAPTLVDLDGDGDRDLVTGESYGTLRTYRNTGSAAVPSFVAVTDATNRFHGGVDVGLYSRSALEDLDADGDLDAVTGQYDGTLRYFRNSGSSSAPAYLPITGTANPFALVSAAGYAPPELVDLDGDGDLDAVLGEFQGTLPYFRNTGTATTPAYTPVTGTASPFSIVDSGYNSGASLADLDGDADLDLVLGERDGALLYYRNTGSSTAPAFQPRTGTANPFDGFNVGQHSAPELVDLDGDGDSDLVVGEQDGVFNYFENTGTSNAPAFVERTGSANPLAGLTTGGRSAPVFADVDGDGSLDLVSGEDGGSLAYWHSVDPFAGGFHDGFENGNPNAWSARQPP